MSELNNKTKQNSSQLSNDDLAKGLLAPNIDEAMLAQQVVGLLDSATADINSKTAQSLSAARNQAVDKLAALQAETQFSQQHGGALLWLGGNFNRVFEQHRLGLSVLIVAAIVLAFFAAQEYGIYNNLEHGDAFLLASDLPPEAYVDQGFDTWLDTATD